MSKPRKDRFRILVMLNVNSKADRGHISGILRFEATHPDWETFLLDDHPSNRRLAVLPYGQPDGVISNDYNLERGLLVPLADATSRLVLVESTQPSPPFPRCAFDTVNIDNAQVGQTAANFLMRKHFAHFAFVGTPHQRRWSDDRMTSFRDTLRAKGFDCHVYVQPRRKKFGWQFERQCLAAWLEKLPKPCGIFVSYDQRAKHVIDACRLGGIPVPGQVGIIGVDNEEFICERTRPALTSILPDFEGAGYCAAEKMDAMLRSNRTVPRPILFGVKGIIERLSTADFSGATRIVELARDFIRNNFASDIRPEEIARAAGVSLRLLEKRFGDASDTTPAEELRTTRLAAVTKLLTETETPIGEIGYMCGFKSEIHLKNLFKARFGMSMREYRTAHAD